MKIEDNKSKDLDAKIFFFLVGVHLFISFGVAAKINYQDITTLEYLMFPLLVVEANFTELEFVVFGPINSLIAMCIYWLIGFLSIKIRNFVKSKSISK